MRMEEVSPAFAGLVELSRADKKTINMYNALCELVHLNCCEEEGIGCAMPTPEQWTDAFNSAKKALDAWKE